MQYEPGVLEACLKLLQVSSEHLSNSCKDYMLRGDPVYLSRVVGAMVRVDAKVMWNRFFYLATVVMNVAEHTCLLSKVNCNDDLGILQGKWEGSYTAGVKPTDWSGSADILRQWASSNCKPVRYGQCWVFASVLCTGSNSIVVQKSSCVTFNEDILHL